MNICKKMGFNTLAFRNKTATTLMKSFNDRHFERLCHTLSAKSFDIAKEMVAMNNSLPKVIEDLENHPIFKQMPLAQEWLRKVINGTVSGGKLARGITTVITYKIVEKPENINEETMRLAYSLGWCSELLHAYGIVIDDIADGSLTRRGRPCWHRRNDVGLAHATNDSILILCSLHQILQNNFSVSRNFVKLHQIYNENLILTSIGQHLDVKRSESKNYDLFTIEFYDTIVKFKSSYYTYLMPISAGMTLANYTDPESIKNCEEISFQLGKLFQMQDDYIDCFGDENFTGKIGSDIQEGKCTWLAVNALMRCNTKNRVVFTACYGSIETAHVDRIKQLYVQLQLPQLFEQEKNKIYNNIKRKIETISSASERQLYTTLSEMTYNRKK